MTTVQARLAEAMLATRSAHGEAYAHDLALAALARLRALRPDVAALLDGHAVAVPRATLDEVEDAIGTLLGTCTVIVGKYPDDGNIYEHEKWAEEELTKARDSLRALLTTDPDGTQEETTE